MESKNLLTLAITLTVGIILAGSLLMPVISDTTKTNDIYTNEGYYRMAELTGEDTTTFVWDATAKTTLTINEVDYDMPSILTKYSSYFTLFGTDTTYFRMAVGGAGTNVIGQIQKADGTTMAAWNSNVDSYDSVTIEVGGGDISITRVNSGVPTTTTTTYSDWAYAFDPNGNFMMKDSDSAAYVLKSSPIYLMGVTAVDSTNVAVYGEGTVEGITLESVYPDDDTIYSNEVINATADGKHKDLFLLNKVTFDMTRSGVTTAATYSYFLVPYEVNAELSQHLDNSEIAILNALPILVIVALVVMAAGALYLKRDD